MTRRQQRLARERRERRARQERAAVQAIRKAAAARKRLLRDSPPDFDLWRVWWREKQRHEMQHIRGTVARLARRLVIYGWDANLRFPTERRLGVWEKAERRARIREQKDYATLLRKARSVEGHALQHQQWRAAQLEKERKSEANRRARLAINAEREIERRRAARFYAKARAARLAMECEEAALGWIAAHPEAMAAMPLNK